MIFCLFSACGQMNKNARFPAQGPHTTPWQESATAKVSCDVQDIKGDEEPGFVLQERGLLQGVQSVFNSWLTKRLLFQEHPAEPLSAQTPDFVQMDSSPQAEHDQEADMYTQTLNVRTTFEPRANLQGTIIDLENERSMAANYDQILIQGQDWTSRADGAFFIVARPVPETHGQALRIIGSGRIYHVLGDLVQGQLLETNKEIHAGDVTYPVWVSARVVEEQEPELGPEQEQSVPEVVVEPEPKPEREWSEPAEPK